MTSVHPTLSQALGDYLALRRARFARATVQNQTFVLRRFIASVGDIQVRHLRPEHVEAFFYGQNGVMATHRTRDGPNRSPVWSSTHHYYRSRLKSFVAYCTQRGLTRAILLAQVTPMRVEVRNRLQPGPEVLCGMLEGETCPRDRAILGRTEYRTGLAELDRPVAVLDEHYLLPAVTGPRYRWRTLDDGQRVQYHVPNRWNCAPRSQDSRGRPGRP